MKNIITIIVCVLFHSCAPVGLLGDKQGQFPFNHAFYDSVTNSRQGTILNAGYCCGMPTTNDSANIINVEDMTLPINAGNYTVVATVTSSRYSNKFIYTINGLLLASVIIAIIWAIYQYKDETIKMPEEYFENYKLNDNERNIG